MNMQPIAQSLAAQGRQGDSMLVHMTPREVGGLQALAQTAGGSLTTNPATGLPEANFLEAILPTVIGIGASALFPAAAPWMIGAGVGGGTALLTGDLNKGLMAGLGAFGGAGLGNALMGMGAAAPGSAAMGALGDEALASGLMGSGANIASAAPVAAAPTGIGANFANMGAGVGQAMAQPGAFGSQLVNNLGGGFGATAAGLGTLGNFSSATQPALETPTLTDTASSIYEGPYVPPERQVSYPGESIRRSSAEYNYFTPSNPVPGYTTFADGGMVSGFQTFGGQGPNLAPYMADPDDPRFRTELEKIRILGKQTAAGIPMNVSGVDAQGAPIYESTLKFQDMPDSTMAYLRDQVGAGSPTLSGPLGRDEIAIQNMYQEILGRKAKEEGLNYWLNDLKSGQSLEDVRRNIMMSEEAQGLGTGRQPTTSTAEKTYQASGTPLAAPAPIPAPAPAPAPAEEVHPLLAFQARKFAEAGIPIANMPMVPSEPSTQDSWGGQFGQNNASGGYIRKAAGGLTALASGGEFLEDGSFVIDARTVAELGNGSSNAGLELLMQMGGRPVQGPGDGVSDSVPATIDGERAAAVARDEVIFDPQAVARIGGGDPEKGAKRLYALMRRAEQARKQVDRGEDSGAGLEALRMAGSV